MADMPFFPGGFGGSSSGGGSSGQGTNDYDLLINKPVINISGYPVIISELGTGVYNIEGTWAITADSDPVDSLKDDLFYVLSDGENCKLTWITAGAIHTYRVADGGTASDVVEDNIATTEDVIGSLVGDF